MLKGFKFLIMTIVITILTSVIVVSSPNQTVKVEAAESFKDIKGHWAEKVIQHALTEGWGDMSLDQLFHPNEPISRGEFLEMFVRAFDLKRNDNYIPFAGLDICCYEDLAAVYEEGFIKVEDYSNLMYEGSQIALFHPIDRIKREEIARITVRALGSDLAGKEFGYMEVAKQYGIIGGYANGSLGARQSTTGAEAVVFIMRTLNLKNTDINTLPPLVAPKLKALPTPIKMGKGLESRNLAANVHGGGGYAETDGVWTYYSDFMNGGKIKKLKIDGKGKESTLNNENSRSINVSNGWIYYLAGRGGWDKYSIYKITTDGKKRTKLSGIGISDIIVSGNWIYYSTHGDNVLYRMKTDGTKKEKLYAAGAVNFNITNNAIYFITEGNPWVTSNEKPKIMKMNLDGSGKKVLLADAYFSNLIVTPEWVYFVRDDNYVNNVYRMKENKTQMTVVVEDVVGNISVINDVIYYQRMDELISLASSNGIQYEPYNKIFRVKEGEEPFLITGETANYGEAMINVVGEYIYYRIASTYKRVKTDGTKEQRLM